MSTGKRLAKRSIIGTRVCAPGDDGKYYSGVIHAVKTPATYPENNNCINLTPNTRYSVRFDSRQGNMGRVTVEFREVDLIGPGFRSVVGLHLQPGQRVFVTYNGREVAGEVVQHDRTSDEVTISIMPQGTEIAMEVVKRLEEVRLLESRKSARLADTDTDFARLADMAGDRKRAASHSIDVPAPTATHLGSRKRRPSSSQDDTSRDALMDECNAALVLMSLSCSPHSPNLGSMWGGTSPGSSSSASWRSSPSPPPLELPSPGGGGVAPPLSSSSASDEGIGMDYPMDHELPRKKKVLIDSQYYSVTFCYGDDVAAKNQPLTRMVFQCTWPGCMFITTTCDSIEAHVRNDHLKARGEITDREEEFYYTEVELASSPPTLSHRDMARPPHEDPEYQRQLVGSFRQGLLSGPINIPLPPPSSPHKLLKLSPRPHSPKIMPASPRRLRGENKKCRKVYGMEHREQWCTQCKWKKACSRFGD